MQVACSSGVNFINMLMCSFYTHKCSGAQLLFHQQNNTQLYKYAQLEVRPIFYAVCSILCVSKIMHKSIGSKDAHRMLLKLTPGLAFFQQGLFFSPGSFVHCKQYQIDVHKICYQIVFYKLCKKIY